MCDTTTIKPPTCTHSACRQAYAATGDARCIQADNEHAALLRLNAAAAAYLLCPSNHRLADLRIAQGAAADVIQGKALL